MNMIERVARAILKARFYDCEPDAYGYREETFWKELDPDHIIDAHDEARAAIKAMREPNAEMLGDGVSQWNTHDDSEEDVDCVYRAMIDAALQDDG